MVAVEKLHATIIPMIRQLLPVKDAIALQIKKTLSTKRSVLISDGIAARSEFGELKPLRGKHLPVKVLESSTSCEVLLTAIEKHANHNQEFCALDDWVLLYPDFKDVICMPGSDESFKLNKYKDELCKPYSQILLYLCLASQFNDLNTSDGASNNNANSNTTDGDHQVNLMSNDNRKPDTDYLLDNFEDNLENYLGLLDDDISSTETAVNEQNNISNAISTFSSYSRSIAVNDDAVPARNSSSNNTAKMVCDLSFQEKLKTIYETLSGVEPLQLSIRRRRIWVDSAEKLKRVFKDGVRFFSVHFIGEEAVDAGDPFKEYFSVLFDDVANNHLLCSGDNSGFTFLHDFNRLKNGDFKLFGSLVASALLGGCAGSRYFMPCAVSKLLDEPSTTLNIKDVPDMDIQVKLYSIIAVQMMKLVLNKQSKLFQKDLI